MTTIEFFYDISSPWTYFACDRIEAFCERNGADLVWKPFLVGGVFNKVNPSVYQRRENPVPPKDNYYQKGHGRLGASSRDYDDQAKCIPAEQC